MTHASSRPQHGPALIGVDWGTSSCRAYLIDGTGRILKTDGTGKGILHVETGGFPEALDTLVGPWRRPHLPIVLSGMVGSRQGWIEAPYVPMPADFDGIAAAMIRHPADPSIHVVPGLAQDPPGEAPDVMRGEETQIIGAIDGGSGRQLLIMPGTHSKWVLIEDRRIVWFATYMTGELFAVLKQHSILGRPMATEGKAEGLGDDQRAFAQGLEAVKALPGSLLQHLFTARTLNLFDRLPGASIDSYLSGLLIGHEIDEALSNLDGPASGSSVVIIGAQALAMRYQRALESVGLSSRTIGGEVAARGQFRLALAAKLLPQLTGVSFE